MKYRNLATHINLAYQMLEQFLISICRHQQEFHSRDVNIQKIKVEKLRNCIDFFKKYGLDITKLNYYNKIDELRLLQNVLKHGDGLSKKKLINLKSDIFENTTMNMYKNTIIDDTLNLSDEDLDEYVNIIKLFLNQIPKKLIHEYYI
jgi:hypothetical protein